MEKNKKLKPVKPGYKFCSKYEKGRCAARKNPQPISEFYPNKNRSDGLQSNCSSCCSVHQRARRKTPEFKKWDKEYHQSTQYKDKKKKSRKSKNNKTYQKAYQKEYRKTEKFKEWQKGYNKKRYEIHGDDIRQRERERWPERKDVYNAKKRVRRRENRVETRISSAKYRVTKLNAVPFWLTDSHFVQIAGFYDKAQKLTKRYGVQYQVDHLYPLQGKNSRGLHVPWNLTVLPAKQNDSKGNKLPEELTGALKRKVLKELSRGT